MRPTRVKVFDADEAGSIVARLSWLARDYRDDFQELIYPDSKELRKLSGQVLTDSGCMVQKAAERLKEQGFGKERFGGPDMFFLRWSWPGQTWDGRNPIKSWMHSPGHWDEYSANTFSIWIPLCNVRRSTTGTFWWSDRKEDIDWWRSQDPNGLRVPWNYHPLVKDGSEPWPDPGVHCEGCEAGEALVFDPSLLHGSTQSVTAPRLSYDLRMAK